MSTPNPFTPSPHIAKLQDYRVIDEVRTYREAERIVDSLADAKFPVENTRIVGVNLEQVEQVTGHMSVAKAFALGALRGAMFGAFVAAFFLIFVPALSVWQVLLFGILVGAVVSATFTGIQQALHGGERDFNSIVALVPNSYEIQVRSTYVNEAISALRQAGFSF